MAQLVLAGVSKSYSRGTRACDDVNLCVADGELLVLVGPSGSGKTTLLRLIAGLEQPTAGTIELDQKLLNGVPPRRRNVAMVFQSHAIYPHWTVYKNISFGLELRAKGSWRRKLLRRIARQPIDGGEADEQERDALVREAARVLEIEPLLQRRANELSGGEEQRVALGRAMVRRPELFLFDEPLSNLDAQLRLEMRRQLKQLHARLGATMIYVTHDQTEALALGDRIGVLNLGRIEQVGTPRQIYEQPANRFVASFIGAGQMNFFEASRDANQSPWRLLAGDWSLEVAGEAWHKGALSAVVGLRPEDIHLCRPGELCRLGEAGNGENAPAGLTTRGLVTLIEHEGDSCLVSLVAEKETKARKQASPEWPGAVLLGKAWVGSGLQPGEHVIAWFDMRRSHWFDGKSGRNLRPTSA